MKRFTYFNKVIISFVCIGLAIFPLRAEKVDTDKAGRLAQHYVQSKRQLSAQDVVRLKYTATQRHRMNRTSQSVVSKRLDVQDTVFYYVFNINENAGGGFIIVSGDDAVTPVLGYSESGSYDENNLPPNFAYWMDYLQQEIRYAILQKLPQSETMRQKWNDHIDGNILSTESAIAPLVRTTWDQEDPYFLLCPMINDEHTVTGCVATAMAQIMNYHRHPVQGTGQSAAYITETLRINIPSVNFAVNYDWFNMLDSYPKNGYNQQEATAVATLMYHCGVSIRMDYGLSSSRGSSASSQNIPGALSNYFGYDKSCSYVSRSSYDNSAWDSLIKAQLDNGLPVLYRGQQGNEAGHAFVCDGYRDDGKFHFNWGWGGIGDNTDGWFVTTVLNTNFGNFNNSQGMVINIRPAVNVPVTEINLNKTSTTVIIGSTEQLSATVTPNNATNKNVTWGSSNTAVATVNGSGLVTGVSEGMATITVTTQDGEMEATCLVTVIRPVSANADLNALSVNPGTLAPVFSANVTSYTVNVANQISNITVSATTADTGATVIGTGVHLLNTGSNEIHVKVTAEDGSTVKTYTVIAIRQVLTSDDASLGSVLVSNRPAYPKPGDAFIWQITVDFTTSITITAIASYHAATVQTSHQGMKTVQVGINIFEIAVTAENGYISNYILEVTVKDLPNSAEENTAHPLRAYPNPACDYIIISGMEGSGILSMFDIFGRRWIQQNIAFPEETIVVSFLPKGCYFVQATEGKNVKMIKIIVE